jgi:hypothetical protein
MPIPIASVPLGCDPSLTGSIIHHATLLKVVELEGVIADCDVDTEDCATFLGRRGGVDADEDDVVQGCTILLSP